MADELQECLSRFPKIDLLKPEQKQAVEALLAGQDVMAILPTGFGKSLIYQMFCMAKLSSNANASVLVISPLNSIIEEQVNELNDLGLPSVQLKENDADCLKAISEGKFRLIFCSAEQCLSEKFKNLLKAEQTRADIEMVVVDESHTVDSWNTDFGSDWNCWSPSKKTG
ncbi:putative ATP-dependent DNA helicase Q1 [Montipora foliosa]|uniref:putative ATP-dependent DNA helicase Q1 n=1 Tax=Montipora foliosa TaxID=591990 RepID=UPI0035F17E93